MHILVIHGPNLNLLGKREPEIYGTFTLDDINAKLSALARELGIEVSFFQSNHEGELVQKIQEAIGVTMRSSSTRGPIHIPALPSATHCPPPASRPLRRTSPNIYRREEFRKHSYISGVAVGQISGFRPG